MTWPHSKLHGICVCFTSVNHFTMSTVAPNQLNLYSIVLSGSPCSIPCRYTVYRLQLHCNIHNDHPSIVYHNSISGRTSARTSFFLCHLTSGHPRLNCSYSLQLHCNIHSRSQWSLHNILDYFLW